MLSNMACNYSCTGLSTNDASTQELSYEFGAISAETAGGPGLCTVTVTADGDGEIDVVLGLTATGLGQPVTDATFTAPLVVPA